MSPQGAIILLVSFIGVFLNLFIFYVQWKGKFFKETIDNVITNLCVSDFGICFTYIWSIIATNGDLYSSGPICGAICFMESLFSPTTSVLLTVLAYCRWSMVVHQTKTKPAKLYKLLAFCWGCGLVLGTLCVSMSLYIVFPSEIHCMGELGFRTWKSGVYFLLGACLLFTCTFLICYFYFAIYKEFKDIGKQMDRPTQGRRERKLFKICATIAVVYYVCMSPLAIEIIWTLIVGSSSKVPLAFDSIVVIAWVLNSTSNPVLYLIFMDKYRRIGKSTISRSGTRSSSGNDRKPGPHSASTRRDPAGRTASNADTDVGLGPVTEDGSGAVPVAGDVELTNV